MEIAKPSDADKDAFRAVFEDRPELEVKPMFGNLAAFLVSNGQMCAGLFGPALGVRLSEDGRAELRAVDGTGDFGPADRPMKEYVALPPNWADDNEHTDAWVARAIEFTSTLPPKKKKSKRS